MVVKKSIGKNQKEKEKIGGENLLELWFHFLSYEARFISDRCFCKGSIQR